MAITRRGAGAVSQGLAQPSLTPAKPGGTVALDLLVATIKFGSFGFVASITPSSGWTLIHREDNSSASSLATYWARGDVASSLFTFSANVDSIAFIVGYTGVNIAAPLDVAASGLLTNTGTSILTSSITTASPEAMIVGAHGSHTFIVNAFDSPWGSIAQSYLNLVGGGGSATSVAVIDGLQIGAGPTGVKSVTATGSSGSVFLGILMALQPTPPPLPVPTGVPITQMAAA